MSVPTSERKVAALQYVETARYLASRIIGFTNRFPKRLANRLTNPLCNHATEAFYHVQAANRIYIRRGEAGESDYARRRGHLQEALGHIDHVASMLDICYELQATDDSLKNPNDNVYEQLANLIDRERSLIGGVMKKDRAARR